MIAVIWRFISPYVTPLLLGALVLFICATVALSVRLKLQTAKVVELTAQTAAMRLTLDALKREADAQAKKLSEAEKQSTVTATRTAVRIKYIKESVLPPSATCDDAAAWAKKLAIERQR